MKVAKSNITFILSLFFPFRTLPVKIFFVHKLSKVKSFLFFKLKKTWKCLLNESVNVSCSADHEEQSNIHIHIHGYSIPFSQKNISVHCVNVQYIALCKDFFCTLNYRFPRLPITLFYMDHKTRIFTHMAPNPAVLSKLLLSEGYSHSAHSVIALTHWVIAKTDLSFLSVCRVSKRGKGNNLFIICSWIGRFHCLNTGKQFLASKRSQPAGENEQWNQPGVLTININKVTTT